MAAVRVCAAGRPPAGHFVRLGPAVCRDGVDESVPCGQKPPTPFVRSPRLNIPPIPWAKVRQRAGGLAFALVLNLLLLLALFTLSPRFEPPRQEDRLPVTFDVEAGEKTEQAQAKAEKAQKREQDSAAVSGPGKGPGGVQLFEAEWYRRPSHAELSPYIPADAPARGYGLVACKTVDHYHVENCQTLGESPMGSGFARAVRLAAWQFLVLPPRVNGKVMVGSWVRIRIDYTRTVVGDDGAGPGE